MFFGRRIVAKADFRKLTPNPFQRHDHELRRLRIRAPSPVRAGDGSPWYIVPWLNRMHVPMRWCAAWVHVFRYVAAVSPRSIPAFRYPTAARWRSWSAMSPAPHRIHYGRTAPADLPCDSAGVAARGGTAYDTLSNIHGGVCTDGRRSARHLMILVCCADGRRQRRADGLAAARRRNWLRERGMAEAARHCAGILGDQRDDCKSDQIGRSAPGNASAFSTPR
jgi:hypothetical protein